MEFWKDFQKDREAILWKSRNVYDISDLAFYLPFQYTYIKTLKIANVVELYINSSFR